MCNRLSDVPTIVELAMRKCFVHLSKRPDPKGWVLTGNFDIRAGGSVLHSDGNGSAVGILARAGMNPAALLTLEISSRESGLDKSMSSWSGEGLGQVLWPDCFRPRLVSDACSDSR